MARRTAPNDDEPRAAEVAKTPRAKTAAAKKPAAKKPAAKTTAKKAGAPKGEAKPKSRTPLRKNAPKGTDTVAIADTAPPAISLAETLGLTAQEALFADRYVVTYNGRLSYVEAGYQSASDNAASVAASKLLRRPNVAEYVRLRGKAMIERAEEEQDKLMQTLSYVAYGDVNDLIYNRVDSCRFCYGDRHLYQFTPSEFERHQEEYVDACDAAKIAGADIPEFDPKGGIGFNPNLEPHPECPECFGRGVSAQVIADTRFLSPSAQALYAGVKVGKNGVEVNINSQEKARETLAKIHRLYDDSTKVNFSFDPVELEAKFGVTMAKSHERAVETLEERRQARELRGDD